MKGEDQILLLQSQPEWSIILPSSKLALLCKVISISHGTAVNYCPLLDKAMPDIMFTHHGIFLFHHIYVCVSVYMCVCVCMVMEGVGVSSSIIL